MSVAHAVPDTCWDRGTQGNDEGCAILPVAHTPQRRVASEPDRKFERIRMGKRQHLTRRAMLKTSAAIAALAAGFVAACSGSEEPSGAGNNPGSGGSGGGGGYGGGYGGSGGGYGGSGGGYGGPYGCGYGYGYGGVGGYGYGCGYGYGWNDFGDLAPGGTWYARLGTRMRASVGAVALLAGALVKDSPRSGPSRT